MGNNATSKQETGDLSMSQRLGGMTWLMGCVGIGLLLSPFLLAADESLDAKLKGILAVQQKAWNEGNIDKFMEAYWKSEKLTFSSGGDTRRGWQKTLEQYKKTYPDRATMGKLTFSNLEVESLGADVALMLGEWKIDGEKPAQGNFSVVWRLIDGQWVIIHDHSSSKESK